MIYDLNGLLTCAGILTSLYDNIRVTTSVCVILSSVLDRQVCLSVLIFSSYSSTSSSSTSSLCSLKESTLLN